MYTTFDHFYIDLFVARLFGLQYMLVFPGPNSNSGFTSNRMGPGVPGPEGNPYYINILYLFTYIYACFAASAASTAPTHPSIKESTTVEAAEGRLLYGWVCGVWGGS